MKLKGSLIYGCKVGQGQEGDRSRESMVGNAGTKFPNRHVVKSPGSTENLELERAQNAYLLCKVIDLLISRDRPGDQEAELIICRIIRLLDLSRIIIPRPTKDVYRKENSVKGVKGMHTNLQFLSRR